jgi:hypothetical protein
VQEAYRLLPGRAASDRLTEVAKAMEIELADQTLKDAWDQIRTFKNPTGVKLHQGCASSNPFPSGLG